MSDAFQKPFGLGCRELRPASQCLRLGCARSVAASLLVRPDALSGHRGRLTRVDAEVGGPAAVAGAYPLEPVRFRCNFIVAPTPAAIRAVRALWHHESSVGRRDGEVQVWAVGSCVALAAVAQWFRIVATTVIGDLVIVILRAVQHKPLDHEGRGLAVNTDDVVTHGHRLGVHARAVSLLPDNVRDEGVCAEYLVQQATHSMLFRVVKVNPERAVGSQQFLHQEEPVAHE